MRSTGELVTQTIALRGAHVPGDPLVLPNVWDVASARAVQQGGFVALATSSSAIAATLGEKDNNTIPVDVAFAIIDRISSSTFLPVTADIEAGYGLGPAELATRLIAAGAAGCNFEDTDHSGNGLIDIEVQAARIAELKDAARSYGVDLVLNARVDAVVRKLGSDDEQLAESIRRAKRYLEAGADCVYPIMMKGKDNIAAFVGEVHAPVNINLQQGRETRAELASLGVARVSYAGGLFRLTGRAMAQIVEAIAKDPDSIFD